MTDLLCPCELSGTSWCLLACEVEAMQEPVKLTRRGTFDGGDGVGIVAVDETSRNGKE